jgi:hypothetical protein
MFHGAGETGKPIKALELGADRHDGWHSSTVTRDTYVNRVVPALAGIAKYQIRSALGVSEPYSSDIRAGKRIPHRRHWEMLAKLTGGFGGGR